MILKKKIPRDFYKLFRTQNMEYYMQLLTALYEADQEAYALTQLTDSECRSILAETIARVNLVWWEAVSYTHLIWHMPFTDAPYVCIEPWSALPSRKGRIEDLSEQPNLVHLPAGKRYENTWSIEIF